MPSPPEGEADLRGLAAQFTGAEARIRGLVARAPEGDRRKLLTAAAAVLIMLRREDFRAPVITAYLAAFRAVRRRGGHAGRDVDDLAGSLAQKLDQGAQTAQGNAREAFRAVTADNVEEMSAAAVVAHVDDRGTSWPLGAWGTMNVTTIGRTASSRGLSDAVGTGGKVNVKVGACGL